jgi:hypothetical protein
MRKKKSAIIAGIVILIFSIVVLRPIFGMIYRILWYGSAEEAAKATMQEFILSGGGTISDEPRSLIYIGESNPANFGLPFKTTVWRIETTKGSEVYVTCGDDTICLNTEDNEVRTFHGWTYGVMWREKESLTKEIVRIHFYPTEGAEDNLTFTSKKPFTIKAQQGSDSDIVETVEGTNIQLDLKEEKLTESDT